MAGIKIRRSKVSPRNPGKGYINIWFNDQGLLMFENDQGHTKEIDTSSFEFELPAPTPTTTGGQRDVRVAGNFMYICYEQNKWGRIPFAKTYVLD